MALGAITVRSVLALKPRSALWDGGHRLAVKGFGVRRQSGGAVYVIKCSVLGRQRFVTIGRHGSPWTPERARREAKRMLGLFASGADPQAERKGARAKAADTLGRIAGDYLEYAKRKQRPGSYRETERHLLVNWRPLHALSIFDLRRRHVAGRLAAIESERGAVTAARARAALSAMFNWAIREGYELAGNPVAGTNRPAEPKSRSRVLADAELAAIWRACRDDAYGRIVRLLMLTGQRRDEVGGMRWSEIEGERWTLPAERTKNRREHVIPLPASALALLADWPRRSGREYVFGNVGRGYSGWWKAKAALDGRCGVASWRVHDLRRTVATVMADRLGVLPHIVEAVLNHVGSRAGVAGVYNRARYEAEMREALTRWAEHVAGIVADA